MKPVRLEPAALRSRVKHSTSEPLRPRVAFKISCAHPAKFVITDPCDMKIFKLLSFLSEHKKQPNTGLEVIKLEFILRLKIKRNDWLLADMCPQAANHCALF